MSKQDKKLLFALVFAQTGVLSALIIFSPFYWIQRAEYWDEIRDMAHLYQLLEKETHRMESNFKMQQYKKSFEKKGIGAEETFNLNRK